MRTKRNGKPSALGRMRGDLPGTLWPPVFSARVASLAALIERLDRTQWLTPGELEAGQFRQLGMLAPHLARHSKPFTERLSQAGLDANALASPEGLRALPPLSRKQAQANDPPIFCDQVPRGHLPLRKVSTSGSTGEPVAVLRTAISRMQWSAMTVRYHLWSEPDFLGRICAIRADMETGPSPDWEPPVATFFETGPGLRIGIETDIARQLELIAEFCVNSLIIYPSNLVALLDEMDAAAMDLPSLERVRTIGETLPDGLRERVAVRTGAFLSDCYSSQEFGYIALQCPDSELYHLMSETLLVEVVDDEGSPCAPGQTGRVLVTDLHNHATPLIRYEIGDHAEPGPPCSCGRGLPTLRRIRGRERNMIVKPDGSRHWPLTGFRRFRDIAPIAQYQMRQHAPERLELRLVVERPLMVSEEEALLAHLQDYLGYPFQVEFSYFEGRLPTGRNGKFEEFLRLF